MKGDGGEQDLGAVVCEHAPHPAGVVMHPDLPDSGQGDRAGAVLVADPNRRPALLRVLIAEPKRRHRTGLLLEAGKAHPLAFALTGPRVQPRRQCSPAVHRAFLEHLLTDRGPPRQAGHHGLGHAIAVDGEDATGVLGFLPAVERVDQIKARPRHRRVRIGLALRKGGFHHPQALIERKTGGTCMPGQHLPLLIVGVEAEFERSVPIHHRRASHQPLTLRLAMVSGGRTVTIASRL